jgi:putative endonuclease
MATHNDLGKAGEELALAYLRKHKYKILDTNWRFGKDEIDIVCKKDKTLVIIEVKTRSSSYFGEPEIFVNKNKQGFLIRAANSYIYKKDIDLECRFDIITVLIEKGRSKISHIEDAFYPTL